MLSRFPFVFLLLLMACGGCRGPTSPELTREDYQVIAQSMSCKLQSSHLLLDRGMDSPDMVLTVGKVVNWTNGNRVKEQSKVYLLEAVKNSIPPEVLKNKRIRFTISAEQARNSGAAKSEGWSFDKREPTHVFSATLRAVTRSSLDNRTDLYSCQYSIMDLKSGEIVWTDDCELERSVNGKSID